MMSKCANPSCSSTFHYLRSGKLFQVPAGDSSRSSVARNPAASKLPTRDEFFWLCGECSKSFTIVVDPVAGVRLAPLTPDRVFGVAV